MVLESTQLPCPVCQRSQASGYRGSSRLFLHPGPLGDHIRGKHPKWAKKHPDSHLLWRRAFLSPPTSSVSGDSSCESSPVTPPRIGPVQATSFTSVVSSFVTKRAQAQGAFEGVDGQAPHAVHASTGARSSPQTISASIWDRQLMSPEPRVVKSEVLAALTSITEQSFHEMWSRPNSAYPHDPDSGEADFQDNPDSLPSHRDSIISLYSGQSDADVNTLPFPLKELETSPPPARPASIHTNDGNQSAERTPVGSKQLSIEDWATDSQTLTNDAGADLIALLHNKRTPTPDSALSPSTTLLGVPSDTEMKIGMCWAQEETVFRTATPQTAVITPESSWPSNETTPQDASFPSRETTPRKSESPLPPIPVLAGDFSLSPSESRQGAIHALRASQKALSLSLLPVPVPAPSTQPLRPKRSQNSLKAPKYSRNVSGESDGWRSHSPDVSSLVDLSPLPPMPSPLPGTPSSSDWEYESPTLLGGLAPIIEVDEASESSPVKSPAVLHPLTSVDQAQNCLLDEPSTPIPRSAVSTKSVRFEDEVEDIKGQGLPSLYASTDESETSFRLYNQQILNEIDSLQAETFPAGYVCETPEPGSPKSSTPSHSSYTPVPNPPKSMSRLHCRSCLKDPCEEITATMCGHIFCNRCIVDAVIKTSKCPCCNAPTLLYCLFRLDLS